MSPANGNVWPLLLCSPLIDHNININLSVIDLQLLVWHRRQNAFDGLSEKQCSHFSIVHYIFGWYYCILCVSLAPCSWYDPLHPVNLFHRDWVRRTDLENISINKAGIYGATHPLLEEHRNTWCLWNVYCSFVSVLWQRWQAGWYRIYLWIANKSNKERPHCMNFVRLTVHSTWAAFGCGRWTKGRKRARMRACERVNTVELLQLFETRSTRTII